MENKTTKAKTKVNQVQKNTVVKIVNNSGGRLIFAPRNGRCIELQQNGDFEYVTVEELQNIKNVARGLLTSYDLIPTEIIEGECELSDVIRFLGMQDYFDKITDERYFDSLIKEYSFEDFKNVFTAGNQGIKTQIASRATTLFKENLFSDYQKMEFLKQITGNDMLFE